MTLKKGFLTKNRPIKKAYQRRNNKVINWIVIFIIIINVLIYFGFVRL